MEASDNAEAIQEGGSEGEGEECEALEIVSCLLFSSGCILSPPDVN